MIRRALIITMLAPVTVVLIVAEVLDEGPRAFVRWVRGLIGQSQTDNEEIEVPEARVVPFSDEN